MKVTIIPYLIFFLASMGFAYFTSGPSRDRQGATKEWLAIPKSSVTQISFESEGKKTEIAREGNSETYWIQTDNTTKSPEGEKVETDKFLASDKLKEVLDSLYTFQVLKIIGAAKDLKLEEFGLDKPSGHFEVKYSGDKSFKLALGKRGFQSPDIFVLDEDKQSVLLVNKQIFAPLERAKARLGLVSPYLFQPDDVSEVNLSVGDKHAEYVRKTKGENKDWFIRSKLDAPDEAFRNWLEKLLKVKVEGYAESAQAASIEQLPRKFSMLLKSDKAELDAFAVFEDSSVTPSRYWLKSKNISVPVQIESSKVASLLGDLATLVR